MKKILISLMVMLLLSACKPGPSTKMINWNNLKLTTDAKCADVTIPPPGACANPDNITAYIQVDANGAPTGVAPIESCGGKHVTWTYEVEKDDAPQFFIVFDPARFPGNSTYNPISKPVKDQGKVVNQDIKITTRARNGALSECMNYMIVVPDKGILDPVFIIKR